MSKIAIAAYDEVLFREIDEGLLPHLASYWLDHLTEDVPRMYADPNITDAEAAQWRWRHMIRSSALAIVATTCRHQQELSAIHSVHQENRPCGLILKSEDRGKVAALSVIHHLEPFRFVISIGSIRGKQLGRLFLNAPYLSDITSLVEPGDKIARFIANQAADVLEEKAD
jgi:hypothetical protein